ncbi:MAG: uridine kinase [Bacteroidota bacterium]
MDSIHGLAGKLIEQLRLHQSSSAFTVAISGIDASGKGLISKLLQQDLENKGYKVANINIDPWQHPLPVRLRKENAAENVYKNIFRWNDFFEQLVFPLQKNRNIYLETTGIRSHADEYYSLVYDFSGVDILLIEGILLFKKQYLSYYDYRIWIDCSFETGLQRAIKRNIEKLETEKLVRDYQTFYYAAQRLHFERDNPVGSADLIFINDRYKLLQS